jgi:CRP-like cAMP-binding protein
MWEMNSNNQNNSPCVTCRLQEKNFCAALLPDSTNHADLGRNPNWQFHERANPGQLICARGEPCGDLFVICQGWAVRFIQLSDGRRQILSVLLPGDTFSASMIFENNFQFSVQALTEVRYSRMDRKNILTKAEANPNIFRVAACISRTERQVSDELATNLGRRTAEERVAYLLIYIVEQIKKREVSRDQGYLFPLRQQHIADMTGLTPEYVSRVIKGFRDSKLIELEGGILRILNQHQLERMGRLK